MKKWEIKRCDWWDEKLGEALYDGWEPFAVTFVPTSNQFIWLRRERES